MELLPEPARIRGSSSARGSSEPHAATDANVLAFMRIIGALKHTPRSGWLLRRVGSTAASSSSRPRPMSAVETVASHSYRMAMMALLFSPKEIDAHKASAIALVHDLPEALVGDLTHRDGVPKAEKHRREREAMASICTYLPQEKARKLMKLYLEYESGDTYESKFVKDLDTFDMLVQAETYEHEHNLSGSEEKQVDKLNLAEFFESSKPFSFRATNRWVGELLFQRTNNKTSVGDDVQRFPLILPDSVKGVLLGDKPKHLIMKEGGNNQQTTAHLTAQAPFETTQKSIQAGMATEKGISGAAEYQVFEKGSTLLYVRRKDVRIVEVVKVDVPSQSYILKVIHNVDQRKLTKTESDKGIEQCSNRLINVQFGSPKLQALKWFQGGKWTASNTHSTRKKIHSVRRVPHSNIPHARFWSGVGFGACFGIMAVTGLQYLVLGDNVWSKMQSHVLSIN